ncbi:hypothetical protein [Halomarina oriensis]|uniref:Uncharacterized protein n=1 Tax=Halomarina oriensis TaxID=671145 RepID=A0A6B0GSE8_9EURY|nr:hypothetical protein [Halomarina oriensis]MWG35553.1 hypothetical protein [Halomarina oriensis]
MSNPLQKPVVHYGMGLLSAAVLLFVAFQFLDGTARYVVVVMAALEVTVVPQILKRAGEQSEPKETA